MSPPWNTPILLPAFMCGLRADSGPDLGSGPQVNTVFLEAGAFADAGGINLWTVPAPIFCDLTRAVGIGSRDRVDPSGAGLNNWADGQAVYLYLIADANNNVGLLASPAWDYGGPNYGGVQVPAGCTLLRKHPWEMCWRTVSGGIPSFHFSGIQNPRIDFSLFGTTPEFYVGGGNATSPTPLDLSGIMPDAGGARLAHLYYMVVPNPGGSGTAYVGATAPVIQLNPGNAQIGGQLCGEITVRVQSPVNPASPKNCNIVYMVNSPNVSVSFWLKGFTNTEVTT